MEKTEAGVIETYLERVTRIPQALRRSAAASILRTVRQPSSKYPRDTSKQRPPPRSPPTEGDWREGLFSCRDEP